jgi:CheY-like chemotaxis protein
VVDDDPDVLALFGRMLSIHDSELEILFADRGVAALELIEQARPDLMLLDMVMPDMDGWQVLASVERSDTYGTVPTFFVSAQDPADRPSFSPFILATIDDGISLSKLLQCSEALSKLLLEAETAPDLAPVGTGAGEPALPDRALRPARAPAPPRG